MEEILIKALESFETAKGQGLKVTFNGNRNATVAPWLDDAKGYIKSVGVGGSVEVVLHTDGKYTNITEVNMTTGKKATAIPEAIKKTFTNEVNSVLAESGRDEIIIGQVILKAAVELAVNETGDIDNIGEYLTNNSNELIATYKHILTGLQAI